MTEDTAPKYEEYGIFTGSDIYQRVAPKVPIIEGIFNRGDNLAISSTAGMGKSILALQLVCALTSGTDFLDTYKVYRKWKVLYVQTESDRAETVHRLIHMRKALPIDDSMWAHFNASGIILNTQEGLTEFMSKIKKIPLDYEIIIIDPIYPTLRGSLSSDEDVTDWQRSTRHIKEYYKNLSYAVFHHDTNKENWQAGKHIEKPPEDLFGSSMWINWVSSNYKLKKDGSVHVLKSGKGEGRGRTGQGVNEIRMRLNEPTPLYYSLDEEGLNETTSKIWAIFNMDKVKKYRRIELEDTVEKSKPTVCKALVTLQRTNKIEKVEEEGIVYYKVKEM